MTLNSNERIRIKLEAFDSNLLDIACKQIISKIEITQSKIIGPIPLPTKKRIYCVLRSPHVNKDAREHFEIRIHKRILDIYPGETNMLHSLVNINLPAGITTTIR